MHLTPSDPVQNSAVYRHVRRALTPTDVLWAIAVIAMLIAVLLPSLGRARELAKQAVCRSNIRGIGMAMMIYANDHNGVGPRHYLEATTTDEGTIRNHGVSWVGAMGSNSDLKVIEATSPAKSPTRSHPSRSAFLLIIGGQSTMRQFICPSVGGRGDQEDDLRNYGPDAKNLPPGQSRAGDLTIEITAGQPGINRFDFLGYDRTSYGFDLPYARLHNIPDATKPMPVKLDNLDPRRVLAADKSPYYTNGGPGLPGTQTTIDARSQLNPPADWAAQTVEQLAQPQQWRKYNSRNHRNEGQSVLYADGHADFAQTPLAGISMENIYTITDQHSFANSVIGVVPDATQAIGPAIETDSFIVP